MCSFKVHVSNQKSSKSFVKIVSGGREAYELFFLKYLSPKVLSAAIIGSKYCPPSSKYIYTCLKDLSSNHEGGLIAIVPDNFEEIINFKRGIAEAIRDQIAVQMVQIRDNCVPERSRRENLAGLAFLFKVAGVMKMSCMKISDICQVLNNLKMKSVSCHLGKSFSFIDTCLESGSGRFLDSSNLSRIVSEMLNYLFLCPNRSSCSRKTCFVLLINSYTSDRILLSLFLEETLKQFKIKTLQIDRVFAGNFIFGRKGFSVTLIESPEENLLSLADVAFLENVVPMVSDIRGPMLPISSTEPLGPYVSHTDFIRIPIMFACEAMMSSKELFNKLDVNSSFGTCIFPALEVILKKATKKELILERPLNLFSRISLILQAHMGGIHGEFFQLFFRGVSQALSHYSVEIPVIHQMWVEALCFGINFVNEHPLIQEEEFTFIDVLSPFTLYLDQKIPLIDQDLGMVLSDALNETNNSLQRTFHVESSKKKIGCPEVSSQAAFTAIIAIVQGIRSVSNTIRVREEYDCSLSL